MIRHPEFKAFLFVMVLVFALYGIAEACAPKSHARPVEQEFLIDLSANGFATNTPDMMIEYGKWICAGFQLGAPPYPFRDLVAFQFQLEADRAETLMQIAVDNFCPTVGGTGQVGGKMGV